MTAAAQTNGLAANRASFELFACRGYLVAACLEQALAHFERLRSPAPRS